MAKCREVERAVKEKTWANQRNEMKMLRLTNPGFLCQKNKKKTCGACWDTHLLHTAS